MAFLTGLLSIAEGIKQPGGIPWEWLILKVFDFIAVYGWRIVLFTVLLKLVLYPLDIFQRYKMRKNQKIAQRLAPEMERLKKSCGGDQAMFQRKQSEVYRREGYSYFSACLPMLLTLVIFIWFFTSLNNISQYMILRQYAEWTDVYDSVYEREIELTDEDGHDYKYYSEQQENADLSEEDRLAYADKAAALLQKAQSAGQQAVHDFYYGDDGNKESFLWIKNIWSPDVPWRTPILKYSDFKKTVGNWGTKVKKSGLSEDDLSDLMSEEKYNIVTKLLREDEKNAANGYLILPILAAGLSFLSQFLSMRQQKKMGQDMGGGGGSKLMMFLFPIIMIIFSVGYTSAFALYIVLNSGITVLLNFLSTAIFAIKDKHEVKVEQTTVIRYGRPDPNDLINKSENKNSVGDKTGRGGNKKGK